MQRIILTFLYSVVMRNFLKIFVGVGYENKEVLKKQKQFIIVSNHNSHLDTMALLSVLPSGIICNTHPVAAGDYFGKSKFKSFVTRFFVNAILIPRSRPKPGETGPDPIQLMLDALDRGESLILFPEGSRGEPEKLQKFKKGIGIILSQRPQICYIPVYMKGMGKVLPKGEKLLVPFNTFVRFGEPVKTKSSTIEGIVEEIEKGILSLKPDFSSFPQKQT